MNKSQTEGLLSSARPVAEVDLTKSEEAQSPAITSSIAEEKPKCIADSPPPLTQKTLQAAPHIGPPPGVLADYIDRAMLAAQLGLTIRTLERWARLRTGPPITFVGRLPLYRIASVRAWLVGQERKMPRTQERIHARHTRRGRRA